MQSKNSARRSLSKSEILLSIIMMLFSVVGVCADPPWPGDKWPTATPESQGMSSTKLNQVPSKIGTAIVIRNGYDIKHYGDPYGNQGGLASCFRSYMTTIYGMLIHSGTITKEQLDESVNKLPLSYAKEFDSDVKLKHLLSYTWKGKDDSGNGSGTPGTEWNYADGYEKMEAIFYHITGEKSWDYINSNLKSVLKGKWYAAGQLYAGGTTDPPYCMDIKACMADAARWGYLWLNKGMWDGTRLVDEWYVDKTIQPFPSPAGGYASIDEGWQIHLNRGGKWTGLPTDSYSAIGAGGNMIWVCPSLNLIVARHGVPPGKRDHIEEFLKAIVDAVDTSSGNQSTAADLKPRLLVLTDIGGDPDDQQSMIRLMVHSNEFEIEGLIASASGTPGELNEAVVQPRLIREIVEGYSMVRDNLAQHAAGYPTAGHLLARIKSGNPNRGLDAIGEGHDTEGSRWIISVVDRPDPRPVNIAIWGGQTDLAQALWQVRAQRGEAGLKAFIERIRIYDVYDQDGIANWIWKEFPGLFYVMSKAPEGHDKREAVFRGMYLGGDESLTSREWMETNIRQAHGPLGLLYPTRTWTAPNPHSAIKEGDTPSWFYFLPTGLNNTSFPNWGGWGGRFVNTEDRIYRDAKDSVKAVTDTRSTVWRWRSAFQRDFQARMDWCVKLPGEANHHPLLVCNGDSTRNTVRIQARPGNTIRLSATGSCDPDGHNLEYRWWYYPEAGTCQEKVEIDRCESSEADVVIPVNASNSEIHVILEVTDDGDPSLTSYRRVIISALQPHQSATVWPGDKWLTASPESQGMSSIKLAQAPSEAEIDIGDVLVIREGIIPGGTDAMERCVDSPQRWAKPIFDAINAGK
ncbi:MAG: DUF1593 domain-containing protein [Bacteroidota bacterium]|nr:DUF1593 domain-containing protein [Bacteroidota bacterium]